MYTIQEQCLIEMLKTPDQIHRYLKTMEYDFTQQGGIPDGRSFRRTIQDHRANCLAGALTAAHFLEANGHEPLMIFTGGIPDSHVLTLYYSGTKVGAIGFSRYPELAYFPAEYETKHDLATAIEDVMTKKGIEVVGSGILNLGDLTSIDWRFGTGNLYNNDIHTEILRHMTDLN